MFDELDKMQGEYSEVLLDPENDIFLTLLGKEYNFTKAYLNMLGYHSSTKNNKRIRHVFFLHYPTLINTLSLKR